MPFGEDIYNGVGSRNSALKYNPADDDVRQKFTGYQKDEETQLDFAEARMYENRHARFTAVDPLLASGNSANPQTFNRYVYVMNSPLAFTDPTGLCPPESPNCRFDPTVPGGQIEDDPVPLNIYQFFGTLGQKLKAEFDRLRGANAVNNIGQTSRYLNYVNEGSFNAPTGSRVGGSLNNVVNTQTLPTIRQFNKEMEKVDAVMEFEPTGIYTFQRDFTFAALDDDYTRMASSTGFLLGGAMLGGGGKSRVAKRGGTALADRAMELHKLLIVPNKKRQPAFHMRTTAVLEGLDSNGIIVRIVASSENTLHRIQQRALRAGEIAVTGSGHAEKTAINAANELGIRPLRIGVSRDICPFCQRPIIENQIIPQTPFRMLFRKYKNELK